MTKSKKNGDNYLNNNNKKKHERKLSMHVTIKTNCCIYNLEKNVKINKIQMDIKDRHF